MCFVLVLYTVYTYVPIIIPIGLHVFCEDTVVVLYTVYLY